MLESSQDQNFPSSPVKYRQEYLLDWFLLSVLVSDHRLFIVFFIFSSPVKRIAPQEGPSVIVVFVTKAPCSHPIFLHAFPIHKLIVSVSGGMKNGSYIREREREGGSSSYLLKDMMHVEKRQKSDNNILY